MSFTAPNNSGIPDAHIALVTVKELSLRMNVQSYNMLPVSATVAEVSKPKYMLIYFWG